MSTTLTGNDEVASIFVTCSLLAPEDGRLEHDERKLVAMASSKAGTAGTLARDEKFITISTP
jgi:hypothetical protein